MADEGVPQARISTLVPVGEPAGVCPCSVELEGQAFVTVLPRQQGLGATISTQHPDLGMPPERTYTDART